MEHHPVLLKADEAARLLSVGKSTIYRALKAGDLHAVKIGASLRIRREELDRWVDSLPPQADHEDSQHEDSQSVTATLMGRTQPQSP